MILWRRPESLSRGLTKIKHVPAGIDDEFHPFGRSIGWQLVELNLRAEIGRGEIEQSVPHEQPQFRIERKNLSELRDRLRRIDPAAEIPGFADRTIQQVIGAIRPPV